MTRNRPDRLQIMLTPEELAALDDFRFKTRMPSRAAAVRELLQRGLRAEGFDLAAAGRHSGSYGVLRDGAGEADADGAESAPKARSERKRKAGAEA